jgi:hypothetical protein
MSKFSFEPDRYERTRIAVTHTNGNLSTTLRLTVEELRDLVRSGGHYLEDYKAPEEIPEGTEVMVLEGAQCYSHLHRHPINVPGVVDGYQARIANAIDSDGDYFITMLTGPDTGRGFWINSQYVKESK